MTISTNIHFLRPVFGSRSTVLLSPRCPDLSFSRWRRCYKSRGSFPVYLASEVQKRSNAPVPSQKLATKVSKSRAIPPYVPGVNPPGWPLTSALLLLEKDHCSINWMGNCFGWGLANDKTALIKPQLV